MLSDGDSRRGQPRARRGRLDRDVVARRARRPRPLAAHRDARRGGASATTGCRSPRTCSRTRRSAPRSSASRRPRSWSGCCRRSRAASSSSARASRSPGAGSDLGSLTTRAELRGDTFVVTGHKIWTSSAQLADWIYLAVRTDPERRSTAASRCSSCPIDTPGIEVRTFPTLGGGVPLRGVPRRRRDPGGEPRRRAERRLGRADVHARLRADHGGEARRRRLGARRGRGAAARDGTARPRRLASSSRGCAASSTPPGCSRSARPTCSTAASRAARPRRWRSSSGARLAQRVGDAVVDLLGLEGLGDASPDAAIQGRAAALYRASVGSTIAGGTAEVQQLVIARRGLGLR